MAALSAWKASDEEILPDYWQVPKYRRLPKRVMPSFLIPAGTLNLGARSYSQSGIRTQGASSANREVKPPMHEDRCAA
jgi:hypothetical protein